MYLMKGSTESKYAVSLSKLKAGYYQDEGIEEMILTVWNNQKEEYDLNAAYGIHHWWHKRQLFYRAMQTCRKDDLPRPNKKIISVVKFDTLTHYGYTHLRNIVIRRGDQQEYELNEGDFHALSLNDIEDLHLLHIQEKLGHLSGSKRYQFWNALTIFTRSIILVEKDDEFKSLATYTVTEKPSAVIYLNMYGRRRLMRSIELIKFCDGTLKKVFNELKHKLMNHKLGTQKKRLKDRKRMQEDKKLIADFIKKIAKLS
ncbi:hypothetical protein Tco_0661918 [Tanacetum coccineum]